MAATRRLNVRFLGVLLGTLLVVALSVYFVNAYQVRRHADALKHRADQAFQEGQYGLAATYYYQYLIQHPDDLEARRNRGQALDKKPTKSLAERKEAYNNFQYVLWRDPNQEEIRRRQVDLALQLGEIDEAMGHIQKLLEEGHYKNDGQLEQLLGACYAARNDDSQAITYYEAALKHAPHHLDSYKELALLYLVRRKDPAKAKEVRERLLAENGERWEAHLLAAAILRQQRLPADEEIKKAFALAPSEAETLVEITNLAYRQNRPDEARRHLEEGLKLHPHNWRMYYLGYRVEAETGHLDKAEEFLRRGLAEVPDADQNSLLQPLVIVLIERGALPQAEQEIAKLRDRGVPEIYLNDLRARVHMQKEEWIEASHLLEGLVPLVAAQPDFAFQVQLELGRCYMNQRLHDRALECFEQALRLRPDAPESLRARRGKADALRAEGKFDDALVEYRLILPRDPSVGLALAELLLERNLRLEPAKRDWKELDEVLRVMPDSPALRILQARLLEVRQNAKDALASLRKAVDKDPTQARAWLALIDMAEKQGKGVDVLPLLDDAEKALGDRVDLRWARARYWLQVGGAAASAALAKLEQPSDKFNAAEQDGLLRGLGELYLLNGRSNDARRVWTQLAKLQPQNLQVRLKLFELAFRNGEEQEFSTLLNEIRKIEGSDGTQWRYCQACQILYGVRQGKLDAEQLKEAKTLLAYVTDQRPKWGRVALREAEIADLEGNVQAALDFYQRALRLGEYDPTFFRRAVFLMYQNGQYRQAESLLAALQERALYLPDDLRWIRISILSQLGNHQGAIDEATKALRAGSKEPTDHYWYAHALAAAGRKDEAEKAYRNALQLPDVDRKQPELWVELVRFLVQTEQKTKAEAVVHDAEKRLAADVAPLVLAKCYETLNQPKTAEEQYLKMLSKDSRHLPTLRSLVNFYERRDQLAQAEPYLRRLLEPQTQALPADQAMARRALAILLASTGNYEKYQEAQELLKQNAKGGKLTLVDQHAQAKLYTKRVYHWRQAIELYEQLQSQPGGLALDEQLDLARLYESYGSKEMWAKARQLYVTILNANPERPDLVYRCMRSLLKNHEVDGMQAWFAKLQKLEDPQSPRVREIQVRLLMEQNKLREGADLLKEYAAREFATPEELRTAAALLEEYREFAAAEEIFKKLASKPGHPEDTLLLAGFLGRRGRDDDIQKALSLCEAAWKTCPPESVGFVAIAILNENKGRTAPYYDRVARALAEALAKNPKSLALLYYLAGLRSLEKKYDEAEQLYRQIIAQDPRNWLAQNNLAWLLVARYGKAKAPEALELVNRAIQSFGPSAEMLDTRGLVYLKLENFEEAVKDLKEAREEESPKEKPSPVVYFHLAQVQALLKDPEAMETFRRAEANKLKEKIHPLEEPSYEQLRKVLGLL